MSIQGKLKPKFWDYQDVAAGPFKRLFNFRRIWMLAVLLTTVVTLVPLISIILIDYKVTQNSIESEILLRTARLVSNTRRTISFFLTERRSALNFMIQDYTLEEFKNPDRLALTLENLKKAFGGYIDIGLINPLGIQEAYIGPYQLEGQDYSNEWWFKEILYRDVYISDVFMGFRQVPHLIIAVRHTQPDKSFYVLRATVDTNKFDQLLSHLEVDGEGDAFIINHQGKLQTPSRYHGKVFETLSLPVPSYSPRTQVLEGKNAKGKTILIGYAYISETPFILMIVKQKDILMKPWYRTRLQLIGFLAASVIIILIVIVGVSTYLVSKIQEADYKRIISLHEVEYSNKLASIGRLAAGVAHEINNPLAIINEKTGLMKDRLIIKKDQIESSTLIDFADSILASVERCAAITNRLLGFARHIDVSIRPINLKEVIHETIDFQGKEAEYRSIEVSVDVPDDIPQFESDRGKLQQIFLNLLNNAFAALSDGGHLNITVRKEKMDLVSITFADDGCGIPAEDLARVFEPFFSTRTMKGGTGLGLSITYGLVQEIGGNITVQSELGKGTSFNITLPLKPPKS
ncbi:MAG: two-component sensor histidine kinase [Deltaproteobacteria bacterium]|nr:two-component sensor histidine kinase [Deltaproteobacteria bacterium]MBW2051209.1 two-component sensor histidine kinase [Deltaproteobacteria bacterium]MBW2139850.1 two-component sensor histidine kinase [Deltaproteobacteria bacterium]MBW2322015.1 two-component sensor histidine kinase [Deltaproteobacteria bacterium]